ncbi:MAG TPA: hypothetical protein VFA39_16515 [Steroidobacteraceae bacterium]|nr:hypothetical protein [Steroidobacteraceae bacterium]
MRTSSPNWSKLAGTRIGLIGDQGTYNVGAMMVNDSSTGALQIPGGSAASPTYLGSSNSSGIETPRLATISAFANGLFGGFHSTGPGVFNGPILAHTGKFPVAYPVGYLVISGLRFTGFSYKGVRIGGNSSGDGPVITGPVTVQNCEFFGGGFNAGDFGDNCVALWIDPFQPASGQGCLITNNWFHDTLGQGGASSSDHLNAVTVWGFSTQCWSVEVSFNTCVKAGNIYGKEGGVEGFTLHHNYVDMSVYTSIGSTGYQDWMSGGGTFNGLTRASSIHHNIVIVHGNTPGGNSGIGFPTLGETSFGSSFGWQTPISIYNNTIVSVAGSAGPLAIMADAAQDQSGIGQVKVYNNIYVNNGSGGSWNGFGNFLTTAKSPAVWDYNLFPASGVQWAIVPDANNFSMCASHAIFTSAPSFSAAMAAGAGITGAEAHSIAGVATFTGTGLYGAQYQLAVGSLGLGAGSTDGTTSGLPCDMGACGNVNKPISVGCDFAT